MWNLLHLKSFWLKRRILGIYIIIYYLFLTACTSSPPTKQNSPEAQRFLEKLLFEEGGVYTLFGSKPLTDILVFHGKETDISLSDLSEDSLKEMTYINDQTTDYLDAWKKFSQQVKWNKFRCFERASPFDPLHVSYFLLNVDNARDVYKKYQTLFTKKLGRKISFNQALEELEDPHSFFWETVFADHELSGLLYGYGEENIETFGKPSSAKAQFTEDVQSYAKINSSHFPLPIYAVSKHDTTTRKYIKERKKIQQIYRNKNFFDVSVKRLAE